MENQVKENRFYAAIGEAPVVTLQPWGLLKGRHATGVEMLEENSEMENIDDLLTTSRGPGTAFHLRWLLLSSFMAKELFLVCLDR